MRSNAWWKMALFSVLCGVGGMVQGAVAEPGLQWSGSVDLRNRHISGMTGGRISTDPMFQPSLVVSRGDCSAGIWASLHLSDTVSYRTGDEVDWTLNCSLSVGSVTHTVTAAYYNLYPLSSTRGDLFALKDTMAFPMVAGWKPTLALELDIPKTRSVLSGGFVYKAEMSRQFQFAGNQLVGSIEFGGHDGAFGVRPEVISFVRTSIALPVQFRPVRITPSLMLQWGGKNGGMAKNEVMFNLNVAW